MRNFTDEDIKRVGLEILDDVHKFCNEHNLKYVLIFGTLLGAVRHGGFIPWDDDIDIAMPRKDYEFFMANYDSENYGCMSCFTNDKYYLPWGKAYDKRTVKKEPYNPEGFEIGFNIDIFPIDEFSSPDNYWQVKTKSFGLIKKYNRATTQLQHDHSFKDFLRKISIKLYSNKTNKYVREMDTFMRKHDISEEKNCLVATSLFLGLKTRNYSFPKEMFEMREIVNFEGGKYYIPMCYKAVLTACYGDYMKLPPENQRVTHHDFEAYFK